MNRPVTTLFLLTSLDGKISTGSTPELDYDNDFKSIDGIKEGLNQYYEIEKTTDEWSLMSGKTLDKLGVNDEKFNVAEINFAILDNYHLKEHGIRYLCSRAEKVVVFTHNSKHPAYDVHDCDNLIVFRNNTVDQALGKLYKSLNCKRITVQTGGEVNSKLLSYHLIDYIHVVIAPVIVGGNETPSMYAGCSNTKLSDLVNLNILKLDKCNMLQNSYVELIYEVINKGGEQ